MRRIASGGMDGRTVRKRRVGRTGWGGLYGERGLCGTVGLRMRGFGGRQIWTGTSGVGEDGRVFGVIP
jgi:hypothetical protein